MYSEVEAVRQRWVLAGNVSGAPSHRRDDGFGSGGSFTEQRVGDGRRSRGGRGRLVSALWEGLQTQRPAAQWGDIHHAS